MSYYLSRYHWQYDLDRYLTSDPREDAEPVHVCSECEDGIYEGETCYKVGDYFCKNCVEKVVAELEEVEY